LVREKMQESSLPARLNEFMQTKAKLSPNRLARAAVLLLTFVVIGRLNLAAADESRASEREAIQRSIGLLEASARQWHADCVSCHHHSLEVITVNAARVQHIVVDDAFLRDQQGSIQQALARSRQKMMEAMNATQRPVTPVSPNPAMIFGYSLFALAETQVATGEATETAVRYLSLRQEPAGNWQSMVKQRPPFEASDFAATALMIKVEREYARGKLADKQIAIARRWLMNTKAADTEDLTFRLLGLRWANASRAEVRGAGRKLLALQRPDGGWPQTRGSVSDAYASGEALAGLRAAGVIQNDTPAFRHGIAFLLSTQQSDGSWHVKSRAQPIQKYFETGFPYGKDQFISYTATCWATLALLSDGTISAIQ
jgi:squalene-hopene cyclase-like protein